MRVMASPAAGRNGMCLSRSTDWPPRLLHTPQCRGCLPQWPRGDSCSCSCGSRPLVLCDSSVAWLGSGVSTGRSAAQEPAMASERSCRSLAMAAGTPGASASGRSGPNRQWALPPVAARASTAAAAALAVGSYAARRQQRLPAWVRGPGYAGAVMSSAGGGGLDDRFVWPLPLPPMGQLAGEQSFENQPLQAAPHGTLQQGTGLPAATGSMAAVTAPLEAHSLSWTGRSAGVGPSGRPADLVTFGEVQEAARRRGLSITLKTLGPFYRIVCRQLKSVPDAMVGVAEGGSSSGGRSGNGAGGGAEAEVGIGTGTEAGTGTGTGSGGGSGERAGAGAGSAGRILAVTTGFVVPAPLALMHCDTLQIFTKGMTGEEGQRVRGGVLGLGLLLGGAVFSYGRSCGAAKAEILAINDDDAWHGRLVRYYSYFGFRVVCRVGGNGLFDLPHMLVWGGEGTRMDADVDSMLAKWTPAIRRALRQPQEGERIAE